MKGFFDFCVIAFALCAVPARAGDADIARVEMALGHRPGDVIVVPQLGRSIRILKVEQRPRGEYAIVVRFAD
jgi:hypothetical protein